MSQYVIHWQNAVSGWATRRELINRHVPDAKTGRGAGLPLFGHGRPFHARCMHQTCIRKGRRPQKQSRKRLFVNHLRRWANSKSGEGGNKTPGILQPSNKSTVACKLVFLQEFASNQSSTVGEGYHRLLRSRFSTNLSQNGGGRLSDRNTLRRLSSVHGEACRCI